MIGRAVRRLAPLIALVAALAVAAPAQAGGLTAGAGRADITGPTGYYMMGWVRSDAKLAGVANRIYARALVLERDGRKVALVAADLGAVPGGLVKHVGDLLADRGFSERNILISPSHTHAAPTGFYNFSTYNTVFMTMNSPADFNVTGEFDPQLYAFMVRRVAEAIRRADADRAPAAAGWGRTRVEGLTRNRSLEAHLANHGVLKEFGTATEADDPDGYAETINPAVDVLRVDKVLRRKGRRRARRVPIGMWSAFANHGTVNPATFTVYNGDHHASATRVAERAMRRRGRVPRRQEVVNAYGNSDEGDMSSALGRRGPAVADEIGRAEAAAFLRAWRGARRGMTRLPAFDSRWTRVCFCGQEVEGGRVDDRAVVGLPLITGSEEGRGPLFDVTQQPFEGRTSPVPSDPEQGSKIPLVEGGPPNAVPLMAVRVGDRAIVSIPGEMTVGMGARVRAAVADAAAGAGIRGAVIAGLANEYLSYFVSPEEYDRQHYEGGSQMFGRLASNLLKGALVDLTQRLVRGEPAPEPYPFDPTNGLGADAPAYPPGAEAARALEQPYSVERLQRSTFTFQGGPRGFDRPLDTPFVTIERRTARGWRPVADDLGLQIMWTVDDSGRYRATWEAPLSARRGEHRFVVTGNRYRLVSQAFIVRRSDALAVQQSGTRDGGRVTVGLAYPAPAGNEDLTYRPRRAAGGRVDFQVAGRRRRVRSRRGTEFTVRAGDAPVTVPAGAARDRYGNVNGTALTIG